MKNLLLCLCVGLSYYSARAAEEMFVGEFYKTGFTAEQVIQDCLANNFADTCHWAETNRICEYAEAKGMVFDKTLAQRFPKKLKTIQELRSKLGTFNLSFTYAEIMRTENSFEIALHGEDVRNEYFIEDISYLIPDTDTKYVHSEATLKRCALLTNRLKAMRVEVDDMVNYRQSAMFEHYPELKRETVAAWGQIVAMFDRLPTPVVEEILTYVEDRIERGNSEWYLTPKEADDAFKPKWWQLRWWR